MKLTNMDMDEIAGQAGTEAPVTDEQAVYNPWSVIQGWLIKEGILQ